MRSHIPLEALFGTSWAMVPRPFHAEGKTSRSSSSISRGDGGGGRRSSKGDDRARLDPAMFLSIGVLETSLDSMV